MLMLVDVPVKSEHEAQSKMFKNLNYDLLHPKIRGPTCLCTSASSNFQNMLEYNYNTALKVAFFKILTCGLLKIVGMEKGFFSYDT